MSATACARCQKELPPETLRDLERGTRCPYCSAALRRVRRNTAPLGRQTLDRMGSVPTAAPPAPASAPAPFARREEAPVDGPAREPGASDDGFGWFQGGRAPSAPSEEAQADGSPKEWLASLLSGPTAVAATPPAPPPAPPSRARPTPPPPTSVRGEVLKEGAVLLARREPTPAPVLAPAPPPARRPTPAPVAAPRVEPSRPPLASRPLAPAPPPSPAPAPALAPALEAELEPTPLPLPLPSPPRAATLVMRPPSQRRFIGLVVVASVGIGVATAFVLRSTGKVGRQAYARPAAAAVVELAAMVPSSPPPASASPPPSPVAPAPPAAEPAAAEPVAAPPPAVEPSEAEERRPPRTRVAAKEEGRPHRPAATGTRHRKIAHRVVASRRHAPAPPPTTGDPREAYERGNGLLFAGNVAGATAAYREAVRLAPSDPIGYRGLGLAYEQQGDMAAAVKALRRYLKLSPEARDRELVSRRIELLARTASHK